MKSRRPSCWYQFHSAAFSPLLVLLCALGAEPTSPNSRTVLQRYEEALDTAFDQSKNASKDRIVIRILCSVQPESEIVFERESSKTSVTYLEFEKSLWSDFRNQSAKAARESELQSKIPAVHKLSVPISTQDATSYVSELRDINLSTTAASVKTPDGKCLEMPAATTYELVTNGGTTRVRITDTSGTDFMSSENPRLLGWVLSVRRSVESALAYSEGKLVRTGDTTNYWNSYLAVSYTVPSMLVATLSDTESDAGATSGLLLKAWEDPSRGRERSGMMLIADYIPGREHLDSPVAYLDKFSSFTKSQGFNVLHLPTTQRYGETRFARADFSKSDMAPPIFQSEFVIFRKNFALAFIFTGSTLDEVDRLAQSLSSLKNDSHGGH